MSVFSSLKWHLTFRVIPFVVLIILIKFTANTLGGEFLSLSPLMGALISANVFLIGFLISGVLSDYKESEKLPGELACSLEVLLDEASIILANKKSPVATDLIHHVHMLTDSLMDWLYKKEKTAELFGKLSALNTVFLALEPLTQANFIARLKQEQSNMRRIITRIHTIRETDFNPAGYAIAEILSFVLCLGLIFTEIKPFHESVFFVAFVSFVLIYMVLLIKELDNPFSYYEKDNLTDIVSLAPLQNFQKRFSEKE
ncbi:MAG: hypothetical protein WC612_04590 [Bdellovibrionales bacterium]|jgi:predicted membrane chloride channel (bestrophin family)